MSFHGTGIMARTVINDLVLDPGKPLQEQLYRQLSRHIVDRRFLPGLQIPSSRQLAGDLGVSRNTVLAVYEQLKAEGFLRTHPGRGVFVHEDIESAIREVSPVRSRPAAATGVFPAPKMPANKGSLRISGHEYNLPFTPGLPYLRAFPLKQWNRTLHHHENRKALLGYDNTQGYQPLRRAVSDYLRTSRGVRCHEDQVIITHGAQQALSLAADVFLNPGDIVLAEDPGYRGARYALSVKQISLRPVPLARQVLDVSALPAGSDAKLLYCTPTHQYPMGGILDVSQRLQLLNWANNTGTWLIEDDYDSEFHFYNKPFAAMQGMLENAPVLYIGSFSKTLLPSLRMGYMVVPEELVDSFVWSKRIAAGESCLLYQAVIAEFIDSGQFARHLRRMRQLYRQKWECFQALVERELQDLVTPVAESAGMHVVLEGRFDDSALCRWLYRRGIGSAPLSEHFIGETRQQGLIMGFASADETQMRDCVRLLRQGIRQLGS